MGNYEVKAELVIDDKKARKAIDRIQKSLGALIKQLDTVNRKMALMGKTMNKSGGMVPKSRPSSKGGGGASRGGGAGSYMMAGAGLGIALGGARVITDQVSAASEFRKEMEMGQMGLATMFNIVDKMPLAGAMSKASDQMIKFNAMAAEAPGSGADMLSIYTRLYGPMKKLGVATSDIEAAVKGSAVMGKAFGIKDVGSLGRDVEEMLTGRAGKRTTKIFALANAWGILNMDAKEFNALKPEERLKVTQDLIARFGPLGKMMAKTWEGASEAFAGWMDLIRDFAASGMFDELGKRLYEINELIQNNMKQVKGYMGLAGKSLGKTAGGMMTVVQSGAKGSGLNPIVAGEAGLAGSLFAGVAAIAAFAAGMISILGPTGAVASIFASIVSVGIGPLIAIVIGALAGLVAIFQLTTQHADTFGSFFATLFGGVFGTVAHILSSTFWAIVAVFRALISLMANILAPVLVVIYGGFLAVVGIILTLVEVVRMVAETFAQLMSSFDGMDDKAATMQTFMIRMQLMAGKAVFYIGQAFSSLLGWIGKVLMTVGAMEKGKAAFSAAKIMSAESLKSAQRIWGMDFSKLGLGDGDEDGTGDGEKPPGGRGKFQAPAEINVQRMIINQEFKGKADPDRVVASFLGAVASQAEGALSSPNDVQRA